MKYYPSDTLYHYCSFETFEKIITNGSLRLLDIEQSDDKEERKLFLTEFLKAFENEMPKYSSKPYNIAYALINGNLKESLLQLGGTSFATCFGDTYLNEDLWNRYAVEKENAPYTGICLKLNVQLFDAIFNHFPMFHFETINYSTNDRNSVIQKILKDFNNLISENYVIPNNLMELYSRKSTDWSKSIANCASILLMEVYSNCALYKTYRWSPQKEHRLLFNSMGEDKDITSTPLSWGKFQISSAQTYITKRGYCSKYRDLLFPELKTQIFTGLYYTDKLPYTLDNIKSILCNNGFDLTTFTIKKISSE